ncbi:hypothetical protein [Pseudomonas putida]|uniref:DUF3077 domain-containing protein n=1 Tax=Pseudomonas putida (strain W619) TaxID=390235 RepID=B1JEE9_PSEPW|nr:hypothetical protein [Pseudomonas putida]QQE83847.1 hypothetical protein JET17_25155 [Pseudomonas putida]
MKKIVPDPPRPLISTPYFTIHSDISPPDAIAHAGQLLRVVVETLDDHCRDHVGEPGLNLLANANHAAYSAYVLIQHAKGRLDDAQDGSRSHES